MVVYFQFVKYMACLYFTMGLLSLPAIVFFYNGNKSKIASVNELITMVSLGNIGESPVACGEGRFDDFKTADGQIVASIDLQCRYGHIAEITEFGQLASSQYSAC